MLLEERKLKVNLGAGVGPFCIFHQPMRSQAGDNLTIGGQPIEVFQLACRRAPAGKEGIPRALSVNLAAPGLRSKTPWRNICVVTVSGRKTAALSAEILQRTGWVRIYVDCLEMFSIGGDTLVKQWLEKQAHSLDKKAW